ncbi:nucleotidyltransferase and HEPN domain-containing protein [Sphingopyxis sp. DBS4]|uniref:nucleotidyltransferase and HEPN domain-containing protein n=1 Tax=Sphingopyxis sp. DBS4 TaxID=2968500 RepID=UPI00214CF28C|nr:nucleotidyltransferase domain-containing protein [Sphingopyxis sp. DBS4]
MRTEIDFLPHRKQRELDIIVEILFQGLRAATENAVGARRNGRILKVILFGSYARGDWVEAPQDANQYRSDYDILVIVNQNELADRATYWEDAERRISDAYLLEKVIKTPANFIVHSLQEVNDALAHGRVFFMEIVKDGVILYQSDDKELGKPKPKTPEMALQAAKDYFEEYMGDATRFLDLFQTAVAKEYNKEAAFLLHQVVENLYQGLLLVLKFYTPYDHNILFLRDMAEQLDRHLYDVWPRGTRAERAMYQKLKDAYRKARYSKHYKISREELDWLSGRVEILGQRVHEICSARIAMLQAEAGA